jgi:L-2-hydroxyglutarate oxidase LhgO
MEDFSITIIGAGVIGLALADELSAHYPQVLVLEKNSRVGQETSSRNSEVIHAGIYYPSGLLKSSLCREGNRLLYEICRQRRIPHRRLGKLIVAVDPEECVRLEEIRQKAIANGVDDLTLIGKKQVRRMEPAVKAMAALFSPSTGIIDTHSLMRSFYLTAEAGGVLITRRSEVTAIASEQRGYQLEINGGEYLIRTRILINSAGLHADRIAGMAGMDLDRADYRLKLCKGNYFSASPSPSLHHLVYPVPPKNNESLGIHATLDLNGRVRFGPDSRYLKNKDGISASSAQGLHPFVPDYTVDEDRRDDFYESIRRYLPEIPREALHPDMSGIRPKLQGPGDPYRDFVIREETKAGYPGLINLIGMESPGLTSCMAIARTIRKMVERILN